MEGSEEGGEVVRREVDKEEGKRRPSNRNHVFHSQIIPVRAYHLTNYHALDFGAEVKSSAVCRFKPRSRHYVNSISTLHHNSLSDVGEFPGERK